MSSIDFSLLESINKMAVTDSIKISLLSPEVVSRWDDFVVSCEEATFFHRAGWKNVIENAFGHKTWFLYAERDQQILGVLPLVEVRSRLFGHSLSSLPFCVYGGIAAANDQARKLLRSWLFNYQLTISSIAILGPTILIG